MDRSNTGASGAGARRSRAEHRQITALFYDIIDSTSLMTQLDAEQFRDLIYSVHVRAAAAIRANHGYLERMLGDGGVAYFGYPEATEDAARNAVSAALAIAADSRRNAETGAFPRVELRIGIATGRVILAGLADANLPPHDDVIGYAPTLAARLQAIATANDIAVSDETYRLSSRSFDYVSLGEHVLKGFPDAMSAWRPIAARARSSRFLGTRDPTLPFRSRQAELSLAHDRWREAMSGHGQVLLTRGEPGIGKSRLLHEIQQSIGVGLADTHLFQFSETARGTPLGPILEWARSKAPDRGDGTADPDASPGGAAATDQGTTGAACADLLRIMADTDADPKDLVAAEELRQRATAAASRALLSTAAETPQLLIFEDVHWADGMSKQVIGALIESIEHTRMLACASTRDQDLDAFGAGSNVSLLLLGRLDLKATSELISSIWPDAPVPDRLAAFIHERSEGIPLFAEEMTRLLREKRAGDQRSPAAWSEILEAEGVATLQDLLDARLALAGPARVVAQAASVIGRDFDRQLLAEIMEADTDEAELDRSIDQLVDTGIFERPLHGRGRMLRFRHVLLRDAAYRSMLSRDRKALHAKIARHLLKHPELHAEAALDIAAHLEHGGDPEGAVGHYLNAARYAAARSALDEARDILDRAASLLPQIPDSTARQELQLGIVAIQGPIMALIKGTGSDDAQRLYADAVALCNRLEDTARTRWFPIYWGWWYTAPDVGQQHRRAKAILDIFAGSAADKETRLQAFHCAWAASYHVGDHATCLSAIEHGLALYDPEPAQTSRNLYGGHDAKVCALGELAQSRWCTGRAVDGRTAIEAAMAWADRIDHLGSRCHALDMHCLMQFYLRDYGRLWQAAADMADVAATHHLPALAAKARIYQGWAGAVGSADRSGLAELRAGLTALQQIETEEDFPLYMGMIGEAEIAIGSPAEALSVLQDAIARAKRSSNLVWLAELERLAAIARTHLDEPPSECAKGVRRAIDIARQQGAGMLVLRALNTLGRIDKASPGLSRELEAAITGIQESVELAEARRVLAGAS